MSLSRQPNIWFKLVQNGSLVAARLWCGIVYKTGPFVLFWTGLDNVDGFKLNGVHVSQRSYTCETLCSCCFRKGISSAQVVSIFDILVMNVSDAKPYK